MLRCNVYFGAATFHDLAGTDFCGFAIFLPTVDGNRTFGYQRLASSAAIRHADELEQIAEFNIFAGKLEFEGLHGGSRWFRQRYGWLALVSSRGIRVTRKCRLTLDNVAMLI